MSVRVNSITMQSSMAVDVSYNWFGTRMATCATDQSFVISSRDDDSKDLWHSDASWNPEQGLINKVAWAHPEFGELVAIGSEDGSVSVWEETPAQLGADPHKWVRRALLRDTQHPVTGLAFAPKQQGLRLAVAHADGWVRLVKDACSPVNIMGAKQLACAQGRNVVRVPGRLYEASDVLEADSWSLENSFRADPSGGPCTCLCWRPHTPGLPDLMVVGTSQGAQVWAYNAAFGRWDVSAHLGPRKLVADVHWAPTIGRPMEWVAVAFDRNVNVYNLTGRADCMQVEEEATLTHGSPVWKVEFNMLGTWLGTSTEDGRVQLWRANLTGEWSLLSQVIGVEK